jgi:hypothetical protein
VHTVCGNEIADDAFVVERRVNRRVRPRAGDMGEDALGASTLI